MAMSFLIRTSLSISFLLSIFSYCRNFTALTMLMDSLYTRNLDVQINGKFLQYIQITGVFSLWNYSVILPVQFFSLNKVQVWWSRILFWFLELLKLIMLVYVQMEAKSWVQVMHSHYLKGQSITGWLPSREWDLPTCIAILNAFSFLRDGYTWRVGDGRCISTLLGMITGLGMLSRSLWCQTSIFWIIIFYGCWHTT